MFVEDTTGLPPELAEQAKQVQQYMAGLEGGSTAGGTTVPGTAPADGGQQPAAGTAEGAQPGPATTDLAAEMSGIEGQQAPQQPGQQPPETTLPQDDGGWEQRYKVLQGKYNAEVPMLHQRLRDLEAELERLKASGPAPAQSSTAPAQGQAQTFPDDLDDQLEAARVEGDHDLVKKLREQIEARNEQRYLEALRREIAPLRQQAVMSAKERYVSELDALAPGWKAQMSDPAFAEFLRQPAPFSGEPLYAILNRADDDLNAVRVSEIYNAFRARQGVGVSTQQQTNTQPAAMPASMVAPPRSSGGGGVVPAGKAITREQLEAAAADVGKGLLSADVYTAMQQQYYQSVFKQ